MPAATVRLVREAKASGNRVVAVGTTSVRALESAADSQGLVQPFRGETRLYIYPGYRFRVADGMMTNFTCPALLCCCSYPRTRASQNSSASTARQLRRTTASTALAMRACYSKPSIKCFSIRWNHPIQVYLLLLHRKVS